MEEGLYLLKGILIGLIFGVPVGVIGIMTIQRTLEHGFLAGVITGLGSVAADLFYGCIGVCGLTAVSDVFLSWERPFRLAGGALIIGLGILTFRKKAEMPKLNGKETTMPDRERSPRFLFLFASSLFTAIANPATILAFLAAFASFGILGGVTGSQSCLLLCGLAVGTGSWWLFLAGVTSMLRERISSRIYGRLNRLLGILMALFGAGAAVGGFL